ncbi:elongation factor P [Candidatus Campbellbacteria bacterium CG11_big_fil_rev_8_21_14_0_20_44_21]|nr:MAG: elongation factor P [Candidatus Campbellbacteria bacterium CG11_big_fil_rev_8_21_14_0_20_44_21]
MGRMLQYNEIKEKKIIELNGEPYEVLSSKVFRKQQRKPVNQTKLKNLITGKVIEESFHQSEKAEEAELETRELKYLYNNKGQYWFSAPENASQRFFVAEEMIPPGFRFIKENEKVSAIEWKNGIIGFKLPVKVSLRVVEAPPSLRGDTATGGDKKIILETGAVITVPLFISEGEMIEVNTETASYAGRAQK